MHLEGLVKRFLLCLAAISLSGCAGESQRCPEGEVWDDFARGCAEKLPDRSTRGSAWSPGTRAFEEATTRWGLDALGVEGVRLSVADVDDDGWPDLSVRKAGSLRDDFRPGGTRATWLLRNREGRGFEDVTRASGFVASRSGDPELGRPVEVVVFADVNNDGAVDAFTGTSAVFGEDTSELMINDGSGNFGFASVSFPARDPARGTTVGAATFLDADLDGWIDLFVGYGLGGGHGQDRLYRNLGTGAFHEITDEAGLSTLPWTSMDELDRALAHANTWGATACDLNGDGYPEILVSSYGRAPNHLWLNDGDGTFSNHSIASGYAFDHRMDWTDNESARCHCRLHPEDEDCAGVPPPEHIRCEGPDDVFRWNHAQDRRPFRLGGNSATTVCADVNGDGFFDLLTTEIVHWDVGGSSDPSELLLHAGDDPPTFRRPGNAATGLARPRDRLDWNDGDMTAAVFDFDNDGRPDVYIGSSDYPGTRGHLFWQGPDGVFWLVPPEEGIDHKSSHGIAVADFDRDGDLDVVVGHSQIRCEDQCYERATVRLFENVLGDRGNWIQLDLRGGEGSNRMAIGARVEVETRGGKQVQQVGGGYGHYGIQHEHALHFGLGEARTAKVTIHWPDRARSTTRFTAQAGYRYRVEQGMPPKALR